MATITRAKRRATRFRGFEKFEHDKTQIAEQLVTALYSDKPNQTLEQVAERCQIAVSTLTNLNSGKTLFPRSDTLWKMAAACGKKLKIV